MRSFNTQRCYASRDPLEATTTSTPGFPAFTSTSTPGFVGYTDAGGEENMYLKSLLAPKDSPPTLNPDANGPCLTKVIRYNEEVTGYANYLIQCTPQSSTTVFRLFGGATETTMIFLKAIAPSQALSENFDRARYQSALFTAMGTTIGAGAFALNGVMHAMSYGDMPVVRGSSFNSLLSQALTENDIIQNVPVDEGVCVIAPPNSTNDWFVPGSNLVEQLGPRFLLQLAADYDVAGNLIPPVVNANTFTPSSAGFPASGIPTGGFQNIFDSDLTVGSGWNGTLIPNGMTGMIDLEFSLEGKSSATGNTLCELFVTNQSGVELFKKNVEVIRYAVGGQISCKISCSIFTVDIVGRIRIATTLAAAGFFHHFDLKVRNVDCIKPGAMNDGAFVLIAGTDTAQRFRLTGLVNYDVTPNAALVKDLKMGGQIVPSPDDQRFANLAFANKVQYGIHTVFRCSDYREFVNSLLNGRSRILVNKTYLSGLGGTWGFKDLWRGFKKVLPIARDLAQPLIGRYLPGQANLINGAVDLIGSSSAPGHASDIGQCSGKGAIKFEQKNPDLYVETSDAYCKTGRDSESTQLSPRWSQPSPTRKETEPRLPEPTKELSAPPQGVQTGLEKLKLIGRCSTKLDDLLMRLKNDPQQLERVIKLLSIDSKEEEPPVVRGADPAYWPYTDQERAIFDSPGGLEALRVQLATNFQAAQLDMIDEGDEKVLARFSNEQQTRFFVCPAVVQESIVKPITMIWTKRPWKRNVAGLTVNYWQPNLDSRLYFHDMFTDKQAVIGVLEALRKSGLPYEEGGYVTLRGTVPIAGESMQGALLCLLMGYPPICAVSASVTWSDAQGDFLFGEVMNVGIKSGMIETSKLNLVIGGMTEESAAPPPRTIGPLTLRKFTGLDAPGRVELYGLLELQCCAFAYNTKNLRKTQEQIKATVKPPVAERELDDSKLEKATKWYDDQVRKGRLKDDMRPVGVKLVSFWENSNRKAPPGNHRLADETLLSDVSQAELKDVYKWASSYAETSEGKKVINNTVLSKLNAFIEDGDHPTSAVQVINLYKARKKSKGPASLPKSKVKEIDLW